MGQTIPQVVVKMSRPTVKIDRSKTGITSFPLKKKTKKQRKKIQQMPSLSEDELEKKYRDEEQFILVQIAGLQYAAALVVPWAVLATSQEHRKGGVACSNQKRVWFFALCQILLSLFASYFFGDTARRDRFLDEGAFGTDKDTVFGFWLIYCLVWAVVLWQEPSQLLRRYLLGFLAVQAFLLLWLFFY